MRGSGVRVTQAAPLFPKTFSAGSLRASGGDAVTPGRRVGPGDVIPVSHPARTKSAWVSLSASGFWHAYRCAFWQTSGCRALSAPEIPGYIYVEALLAEITNRAGGKARLCFSAGLPGSDTMELLGEFGSKLKPKNGLAGYRTARPERPDPVCRTWGCRAQYPAGRDALSCGHLACSRRHTHDRRRDRCITRRRDDEAD